MKEKFQKLHVQLLKAVKEYDLNEGFLVTCSCIKNGKYSLFCL